MNQQANAAVIDAPKANSSVFDLWAQVYDSQLNPLLMLEERETASLLPALEGLDVLDIGCGTGRWLSRLESLGPASLTGIDSSPAMLRRARQKVADTTLLYQNLSSDLSIDNSSKDLVLSSFVVSYLDDLQIFARECARIVRPGGCLLISDMHPATAAKRDWKRSFHIDGVKIEIPAWPRVLQEIISVFSDQGFDVQTLIEPTLDLPERTIFESSGKLADYEELVGVPPIYILKLRRRLSSHFSSLPAKVHALQLTDAPIALGTDAWLEGVLRIDDGHIASIRKNNDSSSPTLHLSDYVILPGLINAHDHLEFGLFPKLGRSAEATPYQNSSEWAHEIHRIHSSTIEQYRRIPKTLHLWWGAIRNLLCGVTTVCHHNPLHPDFELSEFPVQVVGRFGWAHSLNFESDINDKFRSTPLELPFIIHAAEGIDAASFEEIFQLDHMHVLDERTVVVHGLSLDSKGIALLNQRGAALIACPTSNLFLFSQTLSHNQFGSIQQIALGSDSPLTAVGDLLDEIRYVRSEVGLDANTIYKMVTSNAAEMLRLEYGEGQVTESGVANMIAVRRTGNETPASILSELTYNEIELVVRSGQVEMASPAIYERLPQDYRKDMQLLEVADNSRWFRAPLKSLVEEAESILGRGNLRVAGRQVRYAGSI
jgi:cytosine/adenosine deaminase-related metal-dependent hydrolase/ubiquinone/menaquinone biosynthesis C-methylase UbiE